jgi:nicotinate-nucleotide adenylyltransferase
MALANAARERMAEPAASVTAGGRRLPVALAGMRIGVLGGSFNPAHEGHRHASLVALKRLQLDRVWWLVSPQNPLKPERGMAPYAVRRASAEDIARHPKIVVTDIEQALGTRYTIDTLRALKRHHPAVRFIFIMGADNFAMLHRWKHWQAIMAAVPVAVIARPGYGAATLASPAAERFARRRLPEHRAGALAFSKPPIWTCLHAPLNPLSSTALRATSDWPRSAEKAPTGLTPRRSRMSNALHGLLTRPFGDTPLGTSGGREGGRRRRRGA